MYPKNTLNALKHISIGKKDGVEEICIVFDNTNLFIAIELNKEIPQKTMDVCNETLTLNGIEYHLCIMEDTSQVQAYFMYNNNMYIIMHTNKAELVETLNNMEEIKYEN